MQKVTYHKILDMQKQGVQWSINVKQNDKNSRQIIFIISDNGRTYYLTDNCTAEIFALKPDGTTIYNYCTIKDSKCLYDITQQTISAVGTVSCELRIKENGSLVTSSSFNIEVEDVLFNEQSIVSSDEFGVLDTTIDNANKAISNANTAANKANSAATRANNIAQTVENKLANGEFVGPIGKTGKSAYEIAVANGYNGTEEEWLRSLKLAINDNEPSSESTYSSNKIEEKFHSIVTPKKIPFVLDGRDISHTDGVYSDTIYENQDTPLKLGTPPEHTIDLTNCAFPITIKNNNSDKYKLRIWFCNDGSGLTAFNNCYGHHKYDLTGLNSSMTLQHNEIGNFIRLNLDLRSDELISDIEEAMAAISICEARNVLADNVLIDTENIVDDSITREKLAEDIREDLTEISNNVAQLNEDVLKNTEDVTDLLAQINEKTVKNVIDTVGEKIWSNAPKFNCLYFPIEILKDCTIKNISFSTKICDDGSGTAQKYVTLRVLDEFRNESEIGESTIYLDNWKDNEFKSFVFNLNVTLKKGKYYIYVGANQLFLGYQTFAGMYKSECIYVDNYSNTGRYSYATEVSIVDDEKKYEDLIFNAEFNLEVTKEISKLAQITENSDNIKKLSNDVTEIVSCVEGLSTDVTALTDDISKNTEDIAKLSDGISKLPKGMQIAAVLSDDEAAAKIAEISENMSATTPVLLIFGYDAFDTMGIHQNCGMIIIDSGDGNIDNANIIPYSSCEAPYTDEINNGVHECLTYQKNVYDYTAWREILNRTNDVYADGTPLSKIPPRAIKAKYTVLWAEKDNFINIKLSNASTQFRKEDFDSIYVEGEEMTLDINLSVGLSVWELSVTATTSKGQFVYNKMFAKTLEENSGEGTMSLIVSGNVASYIKLTKIYAYGRR